MTKILISKLAIAVTSVFGFNKASAATTENSEITTDCPSCTDVTSDLELQTVDFDKTYLYTEETLAEGAISFLKEQKIPYGVKYFGDGQTVISIKNKDEITLSTQRWGATTRTTKE